MSNKKTTNKLLGTEIRWSSFEVGKAKRKRRLRQASGQILGVSGRKRADNQRNNSKTLSFGEKLKKRKEKKTRLVPPWFRPGGSRRGQCAAGGVTPSRPSSRWFWEASRSCQLAGVPPVAQVLRIDGEFGCSLVCIGSVLSLAVVPTALQKLHKCVTQNTTELLQDTEGDREGEEDALKNRS